MTARLVVAEVAGRSPALAVATSFGDGAFRVAIPLRTVSENNAREHWRTRHRRRASQRAVTTAVLRTTFGTRPGSLGAVHLVRVAPRELDRSDNLPGALKAVLDAVCEWAGVDDRHVAATYGQEYGGVRVYGVRIEIRRAAPGGASW